MNVLRHEWIMARKSMISWILVLCLVTIVFQSVYPSFRDDVEISRDLLGNFPPQVREMLGLSLTTFFTFLGFYGYILNYIALAGSVQAMNLGLGTLSLEDRSKTSDFLLSKPITRRKVYLSKLAVALVVILITNIVLGLFTLFMAKINGSGEFDLGVYVLLQLSLLLIQLFFVAIGFVLSQVTRRIKSVTSLSLGVVFGLFIVNLVGKFIGEDFVRWLTPFGYFDHLQMVTDSSLEIGFTLTAIALSVAGFILSYLIYTKRDVRSGT